MIIRPLFSFGTLKGPIPLLHVWSSYISALSGTFSKFCPFIFWACVTRADIAFRVPTSCKHGNKRSRSISERKGRRRRKGPDILLDPNIWGCTVESRTEMKMKILFPSPLVSFLFMYSSDYAKWTHTHTHIHNFACASKTQTVLESLWN